MRASSRSLGAIPEALHTCIPGAPDVYERESLVCFVGFDLLTFLHDQYNLFTNWSTVAS